MVLAAAFGMTGRHLRGDVREGFRPGYVSHLDSLKWRDGSGNGRSAWSRALRAIVLLTGLSCFTAQANLLSASPEAVPIHQIIIQYKATADLAGHNAADGRQRMHALQVATGLNLTFFREMSGDAQVLRLPGPLPLSEVEKIAAKIARLPDVAYAEADGVMTLAYTPNDPEFTNQWHYFETHGINLPAAWDITTGSTDVRIAVLDNGITDHPDLNGRWIGGYDFVSNPQHANDGDGRDADPRDPGDWITANECFAGSASAVSTWHGTHVAGTIAALADNGLGGAGVNWVSPIVPVRVVGKCFGFVSDIADGMRWAAGLPVIGVPDNPHPARVLNVSLGGIGQCSTTYQNAINDINAAGGIIVVAAGNNSANLNFNTYQPVGCAGVIPVAATDRQGNRAFYSNFGRAIVISAPGGEDMPVAANGVLSTSNDGLTTPTSDSYRYKRGTSMAAPHVSGVISLLLSRDPTLSREEVIQILQSTATPFPPGSDANTNTCGSGIVNAAAALAAQPNAMLTMEAAPGGDVIPSPGNHFYSLGATVTVSAASSPYYNFAGWTGDLGGVHSPTNIIMDGSRLVRAEFAPLLAARGTPHWWLAEHGYGDDFDAAEETDEDNDGHQAWQEYVAQTNPTNAASRLRIVTLDAGSPVLVGFAPTFPERLYTLQSADSLTQDAWDKVAHQGPRPGAKGQDFMTDTNTVSNARYYRIKVALP